MSLVFSTLRKLFLLLAAIALCGGQWAALQIVAWTGMAVTYSSEYGLKKGLARTFDGSAPCSLCKTIRKAQAEENKRPASAPAKAAKLEALHAADFVLEPISFSQGTTLAWPEFCPHAATRPERPLLMPPRGVA